ERQDERDGEQRQHRQRHADERRREHTVTEQVEVDDRMRRPALDENGAAERGDGGGGTCQEPDGAPAPFLAEGQAEREAGKSHAEQGRAGSIESLPRAGGGGGEQTSAG